MVARIIKRCMVILRRICAAYILSHCILTILQKRG